jgi:hypothetical protein
MLSKFGRLLLVATSLAPIALVIGMSFFSTCKRLSAIWIGVAILLLLFCLAFLRALRHGEREAVAIKSISNSDQEVLAFLVTYLLPVLFVRNQSVDPWIEVTIALLIAVVVYHSNIYNFNPLLGIFGYHFYEITTADDISLILITRTRLHKARNVKNIVWISENMVIEGKE